MKLTGMSEEQYNELVFTSGIAYAEEFYGTEDTEALSIITGHKGYWDWYRNQFAQIDELFIHRYAQCEANAALMREIWQGEHTPDKLDVFPGKMVVFEAIQEVWDNLLANRKKQAA